MLHPCYLKQGNPEPGATHKTDQSSDQLAVPAFSFQSHDYLEHRCAIRPGDQHLSTRNRELFANRVLSVANATALIVSFAIIGTIFFIAQYFQEVQGYTVLEGGLRTLPISLGTFVVAPFAGRLAGRIGPRLPVILGAMLAGVAQFLLLRIEPDSSYATLWWDLGLIGIGLVLSPLTAAVLSATPPNRAGLGSSMINTSRQVGISLGTAVLGAFVLQQFSGNIASQFVQRGVPAQASQLPLSGRLPLSPAALHQAINQAFVDALHGSFLISGVGLLAAAVLVAFLLQQKQHATSTRVEAAEAGVLTGASAQS